MSNYKSGNFNFLTDYAQPALFSKMGRDVSYNICIIGFGKQGKAIYNGLSGLNGVNVVAICDSNIKSTAELLTYKKSKVYSDYSEMLNQNKDVDLIIISTTAPFHLDILTDCLKLGNFKILVEKPLDSSIKKANDLSKKLSLEENSRIFVNYSRRSFPDYKGIKNFFRKDIIGEIVSIHAAVGKGELAMIASHYIDYICYLLDEYPIKVSSLLEENKDENTRGQNYVDYYGSCKLVFRSKVTATIDFSANHHSKDSQMLIKGTNGYIFIDEKASFIMIRQNEQMPFVYKLLGTGSSKEGIQRVVVDIFDPKAQNLCTFQDAHEVLKVIYGCHASSENGGAFINLSDALTEYLSIDLCFA